MIGEYFKYKGESYRRIQLNDEWVWYKKKKSYSLRHGHFIDDWGLIQPDETLIRNILREKKLARILGN